MPTPRAAVHRDLEQILRDLKQQGRSTFSVVTNGGTTQPYDTRTVATGRAVETMRLPYQPLPHSLHLYWNGHYQDDAQWSLDGYTLSVANGDGWIRAGDELVAKYLYGDATPRPVTPGTATFIGWSNVELGATAVDVPAGTQVGDVLVLTLRTGNGFGHVRCMPADARITSHQERNYDLGTAWPDKLSVGWGIATSLDPVGVDLYGEGDIANGMLSVYRVTGDITERYSCGDMIHTTPVACDPEIEPGAQGILAVACAGTPDLLSAGWVTDMSRTEGPLIAHRTPPAPAHVTNHAGGETYEWLALSLGVSDA